MNINFWKNDYIKRFDLDEKARVILDYLCAYSEEGAEELFKNEYEEDIHRDEIINDYYKKYGRNKLNELLVEIDFDILDAKEIIKYRQNSEQKNKPKCALIGQDGNIFNLMGIASRVLKENNMREEAKEMSNKIINSHSYDEALSIIGEYVEITDQAGLVDEEEWE